MNSTRWPRTRRAVRRALMVLAATGVASTLFVSATAVPATAHDSLVSTDPADGSTVEDLPQTITMEFSDVVLSIGNEARLTGPDGDTIPLGDLSVDEATVSIPIADTSDDAAGDYTLAWRIVSSDGHPVSGELRFTLAGDDSSETAPGSTSATTDATVASPTAGTSAASSASAALATASAWAPGGWARVLTVAAGGAVIGIAVLMLGIGIGRRLSHRRPYRDEETIPDIRSVEGAPDAPEHDDHDGSEDAPGSSSR